MHWRDGESPCFQSAPLRPREPLALLLTACIDPGIEGSPHVARSNPIERLTDYVTSLRLWLRMPEPAIESIVFIDNSNSCLHLLESVVRQHNIHGRKVELLSYDGNSIPAGLHYGYAELGIIDYALEKSSLGSY